MIYMISSFEFQGTNVSFGLDTNNNPKSRKFEGTIPLIQIVSDKLNRGCCLHRSNISLYILTTKVK